MPLARRMDTDWAKAVKEGLRPVLATLAESEKALLDKAGLYREKISMYQKGKHFPHAANLFAALILLKLPVEIVDPETGQRFVLKFEEADDQLELPLELT